MQSLIKASRAFALFTLFYLAGYAVPALAQRTEDQLRGCTRIDHHCTIHYAYCTYVDKYCEKVCGNYSCCYYEWGYCNHAYNIMSNSQICGGTCQHG